MCTCFGKRERIFVYFYLIRVRGDKCVLLLGKGEEGYMCTFAEYRGAWLHMFMSNKGLGVVCVFLLRRGLYVLCLVTGGRIQMYFDGFGKVYVYRGTGYMCTLLSKREGSVLCIYIHLMNRGKREYVYFCWVRERARYVYYLFIHFHLHFFSFFFFFLWKEM